MCAYTSLFSRLVVIVVVVVKLVVEVVVVVVVVLVSIVLVRSYTMGHIRVLCSSVATTSDLYRSDLILKSVYLPCSV